VQAYKNIPAVKAINRILARKKRNKITVITALVYGVNYDFSKSEVTSLGKMDY